MPAGGRRPPRLAPPPASLSKGVEPRPRAPCTAIPYYRACRPGATMVADSPRRGGPGGAIPPLANWRRLLHSRAIKPEDLGALANVLDRTVLVLSRLANDLARLES